MLNLTLLSIRSRRPRILCVAALEIVMWAGRHQSGRADAGVSGYASRLIKPAACRMYFVHYYRSGSMQSGLRMHEILAPIARWCVRALPCNPVLWP